MNFILEKKNKGGRLILQGDLSVGRIRQVHDEVEKSLEKVKDLTVDVHEATEVDLTFLQLLCSAHRTATKKNKAFSLSGRPNPAMDRAICDHFYGREKGCVLDKTNTCLWMVREDE